LVVSEQPLHLREGRIGPRGYGVRQAWYLGRKKGSRSVPAGMNNLDTEDPSDSSMIRGGGFGPVGTLGHSKEKIALNKEPHQTWTGGRASYGKI